MSTSFGEVWEMLTRVSEDMCRIPLALSELETQHRQLHAEIERLSAENQNLRDELLALRRGEVELRLDELPRRKPHITTMRDEVSDE